MSFAERYVFIRGVGSASALLCLPFFILWMNSTSGAYPRGSKLLFDLRLWFYGLTGLAVFFGPLIWASWYAHTHSSVHPHVT
jgi:hypothetical protein